MKHITQEILSQADQTETAKQIITQGAEVIYDKLDKVITEPNDAYCETVDIEGIENEALNAVENVQDFMMNIDLANSQFNLQNLYEEA